MKLINALVAAIVIKNVVITALLIFGHALTSLADSTAAFLQDALIDLINE